MITVGQIFEERALGRMVQVFFTVLVQSLRKYQAVRIKPELEKFFITVHPPPLWPLTDLEEVVVMGHDNVLRVGVEREPVLRSFRKPIYTKEQVVLNHVQGSLSKHVWRMSYKSTH